MLDHSNKHLALTRLTGAVLLALGLAACQQEPASNLRAQAQAHHQKGEFTTAIIKLKNLLSEEPGDGEARLHLARVYNDTGEVLSAEKEIRLAIRAGLAQERVLPVLGKALLLQGEYQKALDETKAGAASNNPELQSVRGDALLALGKRDEARALYERALQARAEFPDALIGLGKLAILAGDQAGADAYAARAHSAEPRNTDVLLFQGDLLRARNQPEKAMAVYDQVLAISPSHRSVHVEKAYLALGMGRYDQAQASLDAALKLAPGSLLAAYTQSLLDFTQGKYAAAQESILKVLRLAPEHMPSVLLAGAIHLNLGSLNQAEAHLRHYVLANPGNVYARKLLASALLRSGHSPEAIAVLEPALKEQQKDVQLLALAGESYMQVRNFDKAGGFFELASQLDPNAADLRTSLAMSKLGRGETAQALSDLQLATRMDVKSQSAGMTLVRTELQLKHYDKAMAAARALEKAQPDNAGVHNLIGLVDAAMKDMAQARASFARALALQPAYFEAAINLAQLELAAGDADGAERQLTAYLSHNKASVEAMTALASLAQARNKSEQATKWLEQAVAVDAAALAPSINLTAHYLMTGQSPKALLVARKLLVTNPDNPDLLDLMGRSQLASGDQPGALATYKQLAVALPRSPHAQMQLAALEMVRNNLPAAEVALKTALGIQPDFPAAQLALADLLVRKGAPDTALLIAYKLQRQHPKASAGFQLEGDILMTRKKAPEALAAFDKAFALSRTDELLIKNVNALRMAGKPDEAARRLAQWLQAKPGDLRVQLFKAHTAMADKQYKQAAQQLESILAKHPENAAALNNLALAYQALKDARALPTAEKAFQQAKEQASVMDTLGWILVEQGEHGRGVEMLQKARKLTPLARDIRYHLAVGMAKAGDKAAARKELESLVAGDMQCAEANEVRALLKQVQ